MSKDDEAALRQDNLIAAFGTRTKYFVEMLSTDKRDPKHEPDFAEGVVECDGHKTYDGAVACAEHNKKLAAHRGAHVKKMMGTLAKGLGVDPQLEHFELRLVVLKVVMSIGEEIPL